MTLLKRCTIDEIIGLRHRVLRPGLSIDTARFSEDNLKSTIHYGFFQQDELCVCLTMLVSSLDDQDAWQLRGMATDSRVQGLGYGSQLIQFAVLDAIEDGFSNIFWCNARLAAVPFYENNGWEIISPLFEVPIFGPHHKMKFISQESP
jgi:GNAT superfamily N-acetyltransferase